MTNFTEIEKIAAEFNYDLEKIGLKIRAIQSAKCNLKKRRGKIDYNAELTKLLTEEEFYKQVRQFITCKPKPTTQFDQSDVDSLDYEATLRAIEAIRSKKANTRWLTSTEGDNDEFRNACKIEQMLLEHKSKLKPVETGLLRKSELIAVIEEIETLENLSHERIVEMLRSLI